jgi:hypothetical protein
MRKNILTLFCLAALALPLSVAASGTYSARPIRPPVSAVDANKYNIGKHIFSGKYDPGKPPGAAAAQTPRLKALQEKLPKSVQKTRDLPALAGKLSNEQMQSLEYYLGVRYKIK